MAILLSAIAAKFLPTTNRLGSRTKATAHSGSAALSYDRALAAKIGYRGPRHRAPLSDFIGYTFVGEV